MSIIKSTIDNVGIELSDLWEVPRDDPKVLYEFEEANTEGVFQFAGYGMKQLLREMAPINSFEELVAAVALYRPGPKDSGMMKLYIDRKAGMESTYYVHPALEPILRDTYGVIL